MAKKAVEYGNESISSLKGADRVRKRPAVIFGSDGIEGCQHSIFEILSNSIDEAREGFGREIVLTRFEDGSIEVEDHGRGIPVDYNKNEDRYNWELVFCELYAGGKYNNASAESYEYSLGLNGLGLCSTQYASEYMDVDIRRWAPVHAPFRAWGKRGRTPARSLTQKRIPALKSNGSRTFRFSPILTCR